MTEEKITMKPVKCVDDNGVETNCFVMTCDSCGFTPIFVEVEKMMSNGCYGCPSCEVMNFNHFEKAE